MCFKQDMVELGLLCEQPSNDNCHIGVDEIDGADEHILNTTELIGMQPCHFDVCGNSGCMCEICMAEAVRKEEKSMKYRLLTIKTVNETFKTAMICRNCKSNSVEILVLQCAHVITCSRWADILVTYPLCGESVLAIARIYMV